MGVKNWVRGDAVLPYRINFENLGPGSVDGSGNPYSTFASAPAQRVTISDQLHPGLDWSTFQLVELGFGDTMVPIPAGRTHYAGSVPMTFKGRTFNVELQAGIDLASGRVFIVFQSVDPQTSLPPDVLTGFLPPEDGTGRGMGHFSFLLRARTNLVTGTELRNVALIEFDRQTTIATDQVDPLNPAAGVDPDKQALVTIDSGAPTSSVTPLPAESGRAFIVQWSGVDDPGGSGVASYDIYVSTNGGLFGLWLEGTAATAMPFIGELGQTYAFYSVARDWVGNTESAPLAPDAQTTVSTNSPILASVEDQVLSVGLTFSVTNVVVQGLPAGEYHFSLLQGPFGASVNPTNGTLQWTPPCSAGSTTNPITVWVTDSGQTNLSDAAIFDLVVRECLLPRLGTLVLPAGGTGVLPIYLDSTEVLTNLVMSVALPPGRLIDPVVELVAAEVCGNSLQEVSNSLHRLTFPVCAGESLEPAQGKLLAWLQVSAASNQPSAFVYVNVGNSIGTTPEGVMVTNHVTQTARVVIVGEEPLLESVRSTNGQAQLILYALPGTTNLILSATNLADVASWHIKWDVLSTNLLQFVEPFAPTNQMEFFRAVRRGPLALAISQSKANSARLRWGPEYFPATLEGASSPHGAWMPLTNQPGMGSTGWYLEIPIEGTEQFFRVRLP
jgi:hypothetical protein